MTVARDLLRPDNHDLFDRVRLMLVARDPVIPFATICAEFAVSEDELIRWFLAYKSPRRDKTGHKAKPYQSRTFAALRPAPGDDDKTRRFLNWKKQHDGARAALEAMQ